MPDETRKTRKTAAQCKLLDGLSALHARECAIRDELDSIIAQRRTMTRALMALIEAGDK